MPDQPTEPSSGASNPTPSPEPSPEPVSESEDTKKAKPRKKAKLSTSISTKKTTRTPRTKKSLSAEPALQPEPSPAPSELPKPPPPTSPAYRFAPAYLLGAAILFAVIYMAFQCRGLSSATAMDQAQIARHIAEGKGFSTAYIRPLALWQLETSGKPIPQGNFPDFFHAPLNPLLNSIPLKLVEPHWKLSPTDIIYIGDRAIAAFGILIFLAALALWYLVALRLFSPFVAFLGTAVLLTTDLLWQFSISGLPQPLGLLFFSAATWLSLKSTAASLSSSRRLLLLAGAGLCMGLLVLTHSAAAWILPGWIFFISRFFQPRLPSIGVGIIAIVLVVTPWLVRNHSVSGSAFGLAVYELVAPANTTETGYMRNLYNPPAATATKLLARFQDNLATHADSLFALLGTNIAAVVFFISLLHRFDSPAANRFRWPLLVMWLCATLGMIIAGTSGALSPNNLHILFLPLFVFYGVAFLWGQVAKLPLPHPRIAFPTALILLCGLPMWNTLLANKPPVQWPPYVPPFIAILGEWYDTDEVIASDMPWAVAWYAQRKSLLLPQTIKDFNRISDYRVLGNAITGLYLTPLTGNRRLFTEIYKGPYTDWVLQITRPPVVTGFPLPVFTPLPIDGECILFSDRDRWSRRD